VSLLNIGRGPSCYNYYVLRGIITDAVINEARAVVQCLPQQDSIYSRSAANRMFAYLDRMPSLVALLRQTLDDVHIIGSNFFCSEPTDPSRHYHWEWHSGHSLYFGVKKGAAMTLWIPLQDVNEGTRGRLKIYNGQYISQIDDLLNCQVRYTGNSIANEHSILKYLNHELDANHKVESMRAGDALLFDEMLPHQAEEPCRIHREILTVRLVVGAYELDEELIRQVLHRYKTVPGECTYAQELLENLLEYGEYHAPGSIERERLDVVERCG
jgi:hypothetical protein